MFNEQNFLFLFTTHTHIHINKPSLHNNALSLFLFDVFFFVIVPFISNILIINCNQTLCNRFFFTFFTHNNLLKNIFYLSKSSFFFFLINSMEPQISNPYLYTAWVHYLYVLYCFEKIQLSLDENWLCINMLRKVNKLNI